jgi:DNA-binding response OmpR family regulator
VARILVMDDDEQIRLLLQRALERRGHQVVMAADGRAGLAAFAEQPADLLVIDLIMPDKEGLETIIELRRDHAEVPIIAISGGGRVAPKGYLDVAKRLGAAKVFSKPFDMDAFHAAVAELLKPAD